MQIRGRTKPPVCQTVKYVIGLSKVHWSSLKFAPKYEPSSHVVTRAARTKLAPLAPGLHESSLHPCISHRQYFRKCHSLQCGQCGRHFAKMSYLTISLVPDHLSTLNKIVWICCRFLWCCVEYVWYYVNIYMITWSCCRCPGGLCNNLSVTHWSFSPKPNKVSEPGSGVRLDVVQWGRAHHMR